MNEDRDSTSSPTGQGIDGQPGIVVMTGADTGGDGAAAAGKILDGTGHLDGGNVAVDSRVVLDGNSFTGGQDGVLAPAVKRIKGRWPKGVSGNPGGRMGRGRELLDAFDDRFPPERCMDILDKAIEIGIETRSGRTLVDAIKLRYAYGAGKPPNFKVNINTTVAGSMIERLEAIGNQWDSEGAEDEGDTL